MIQISHLLVLSQPDFVGRQVRTLLSEAPATRRARKFFLF